MAEAAGNSEAELAGVHPHLVAVVRRAWEHGARFRVVQGRRSIEQEQELVERHTSQTLHSRHLPNSKNWGCAVDLVVLGDGGQPDWAKGREARVYGTLARLIKSAAWELTVPLVWGGDWQTWKDWDHFELPEEIYP